MKGNESNFQFCFSKPRRGYLQTNANCRAGSRFTRATNSARLSETRRAAETAATHTRDTVGEGYCSLFPNSRYRDTGARGFFSDGAFNLPRVCVWYCVASFLLIASSRKPWPLIFIYSELPESVSLSLEVRAMPPFPLLYTVDASTDGPDGILLSVSCTRSEIEGFVPHRHAACSCRRRARSL